MPAEKELSNVMSDATIYDIYMCNYVAKQKRIHIIRKEIVQINSYNSKDTSILLQL